VSVILAKYLIDIGFMFYHYFLRIVAASSLLLYPISTSQQTIYLNKIGNQVFGDHFVAKRWPFFDLDY